MTLISLHNATSQKNFNFTTAPGPKKITRGTSKNEVYFPVATPYNSQNQIISNVKTEQISYFLEILPSRFKSVNKEKIIEFLENCESDIEEIASVFVYANKLISAEFSDFWKAIVQKYHDPETKDNYIAIDLRMKEYPDDITERIWIIRDRLQEKFSHIDWILISTDFVRLKD